MKTLFSRQVDFENFLKVYTGYDKFHGNVVSHLDEPEKYPCVLVYEIEIDNNGPDYINGEYVYLEDFNLDNYET